jgi:hypothetical protein
MQAVRAAGREWIIDPSGDGRGVELSEWEKDKWTYHAKGGYSPLLGPSFSLMSTEFQASGYHRRKEICPSLQCSVRQTSTPALHTWTLNYRSLWLFLRSLRRQNLGARS